MEKKIRKEFSHLIYREKHREKNPTHKEFCRTCKRCIVCSNRNNCTYDPEYPGLASDYIGCYCERKYDSDSDDSTEYDSGSSESDSSESESESDSSSKDDVESESEPESESAASERRTRKYLLNKIDNSIPTAMATDTATSTKTNFIYTY